MALLIIYSVMTFLITIILGTFLLNIKHKIRSKGLFSRLEEIENINNYKTKYENPHFIEKMYKQYFQGYFEKSTLVNKITKLLNINLAEIQRELDRAGIENISPQAIASLKILGFYLIVLSLLLFVSIQKTEILLLCLIGALGFIGPNYILRKKYNQRRNIFLNDYVFFLRLVAEATEKGLNEQAAFSKVVNNYICPLTVEFKKAEQKAIVNNDWFKEMEDLITKMDIDEIKTMMIELRIAKEKGIPITNIFTRLVDKTEHELASQYTAEARKKSVTMTLPTIFFLFMPTLALLLLPLIDSVMNAF